MTEITRVLLFMASCVFTHNVVFSRMLGVVEAAKERRFETALLYGTAVAIIMPLSAVLCWLAQAALVSLHMEYLQIIAFTLAVVVVTWLVQLCIFKVYPKWGEALDNCMLPIAANCAVLGLAVINAEAGYGFVDALLSGLFSGLGFLFAVILLAGVQEKKEFGKVPDAFQGVPIAMICTGLIALAFAGFKGIL